MLHPASPGTLTSMSPKRPAVPQGGPPAGRSLMADVTNNLSPQGHGAPQTPSKRTGNVQMTRSATFSARKRKSMLAQGHNFSPSDNPFAASDSEGESFENQQMMSSQLVPTERPSEAFNYSRQFPMSAGAHQMRTKRARLSLHDTPIRRSRTALQRFDDDLNTATVDDSTQVNRRLSVSAQHKTRSDASKAMDTFHRVSDNISVGSKLVVMRRRTLQEGKFTHVISVDGTAERNTDMFKGYFRAEVDEDPFSLSLSSALEATETIREWLEQDPTAEILIQDARGADCAGFIVATYFIVELKMTIEEALAKIADAREVSLTNEHLISQLRFLGSEVFRLFMTCGVDEQYKWWIWSSDGVNEPTARELELGSLLKEHDRRLTVAASELEENMDALEEAQTSESEARAIIERIMSSARALVDAKSNEAAEKSAELEIVRERAAALEAEAKHYRQKYEENEHLAEKLKVALAHERAAHTGNLKTLLEDVEKSEEAQALADKLQARLSHQMQLTQSLEQNVADQDQHIELLQASLAERNQALAIRNKEITLLRKQLMAYQ